MQQHVRQLFVWMQPAHLRLAAEYLGCQLELIKAVAAGEAKIVGLLIMSALLFGKQSLHTVICCPSFELFTCWSCFQKHMQIQDVHACCIIGLVRSLFDAAPKLGSSYLLPYR